MPSWPIPWIISCYRTEVKISTKTSVQLELVEAHPNWSTLACFSHFSLIRAQNCIPFFFVGFLTLQRIFCQNLRIFLNRFATGLANSSEQLAEAHPNWSTLACFSHFSLIRTQNYAPFFCWIPYSYKNIQSKFENFSQPARPVCNWLSWFIRAAR